MSGAECSVETSGGAGYLAPFLPRSGVSLSAPGTSALPLYNVQLLVHIFSLLLYSEHIVTGAYATSSKQLVVGISAPPFYNEQLLVHTFGRYFCLW